MNPETWREVLRTRLDATSSEMPRYLRLREALSGLLENEASGIGVLPGERSLASMTGFSRVTVRKALAGLAAQGVVQPRAGSGTYVGERIVRSLSRLTGFTEDLRERGLDPRVVFLERGRGQATREEALGLGLSPSACVIRFRRLRYGGEQPLAVERTAVPQSVLGSPDAVRESLYEALERIGCRPVRALQRIRAVPIGPEAARRLGLEPGAAGLEIERRAFLADGRAVEFTRSTYRGDAYDFVAELHTGAG